MSDHFTAPENDAAAATIDQNTTSGGFHPIQITGTKNGVSQEHGAWKLTDLFLAGDGSKSPVSISSLLDSGKILTDKFHTMITGSPNGSMPTNEHEKPRSSTPIARRELYQRSPRGSRLDIASVVESAMVKNAMNLKPATPDNQSISQVAMAFQRQEEINQTNAQLVKLNYMVNLANFMKQRQTEEAVAIGRKQLITLTQKIHEQSIEIESLNESVDTLTTEANHQKELSDRLSSSLHSQQELLSRTIMESRLEMERQGSLIDKQQRMVQALLQEKIRHDFLVDSGLLLTSIYISNSILLRYPLELFTSLIPKRKPRIWIHQFLRLVFIIKIFMILKRFSIKAGVHNSIGSIIPYLHTASVVIKRKFGLDN